MVNETIQARREKVLRALRFGDWKQVHGTRASLTEDKERCAAGVVAETLTGDAWTSCFKLATMLEVEVDSFVWVEYLNDITRADFAAIADYLELEWKNQGGMPERLTEQPAKL